jgi:ubiquitin-conjugating enzyme E2 M
MTTHFPDPSDVLNFNLTITPDEGGSAWRCGRAAGNTEQHGMTPAMFFVQRLKWSIPGIYKGGVFHFTFAINLNYPHEPPKVRCTQKVRPQTSACGLRDYHLPFPP